MIRLDYLKYLQLTGEYDVAQLDDRVVQRAIRAVRDGQMWIARPAMQVEFDGCLFHIKSHFHRVEAARLLGARHTEFWCDISIDRAVLPTAYIPLEHAEQ